MSSTVLYIDNNSLASIAVLLVVKSLGLKNIEIKEISVMKGKTRTPEFIAINPQHTVPTLNDNGHILWESRAIMTYLVETRCPGHRLYPLNSKTKSVINQRLYFDACTVTPRLHELLLPLFFGTTSEISTEFQTKIYEMFGLMDAFLKDSKWIAGNDVTVADLSILTTITGFVEIGVGLDKYPNVKRWLEQCKKLPGFEDYHKGMLAWCDMIKPKITKGFE
uniref:glutathione transferase n=1 Tax=Culicoides sonorensis TaxID=179676 RepID=A0A336M9L0_CULSO